jgi:hypothetical protein
MSMEATIPLTPEEQEVMDYVQTVSREGLPVPKLLAESLDRIRTAENGIEALAEENRWLMALALRRYRDSGDIH